MKRKVSVVILTGSSDRHFYFVNKVIASGAEVAGVFTGAKKSKKSLREKIVRRLRNPVFLIKNIFLNSIYSGSLKRFYIEKNLSEEKCFGGQKDLFYKNLGSLHVEEVSPAYRSINSEYYRNKIAALKADVVIVFGTCLISKELISDSKVMLNIHTGLSPYYRGGNTNFWPFLNGDKDGFGVTIHKMSAGIDSGAIVFSNKVPWSPGKTYSDINCEAIKIGTEKMIEAIKLIQSDSLSSIEQWESGLLFNNRDFNGLACKKYFDVLDGVSFQKATEYQNKFSEVSNGEIIQGAGGNK